MSYARPDHIECFEVAESYKREARRCGCGAPMARTSSLHCCHICYRKQQDREMGKGMAHKRYAARG